MERDELAHKIEGMEDMISDLSGIVTAHHVAFEKFGTLFEEMGGSADIASTLRSKEAQKALKGLRDNILNVGDSPHTSNLSVHYPADEYSTRLLQYYAYSQYRKYRLYRGIRSGPRFC
jgi:hypothetical protein